MNQKQAKYIRASLKAAGINPQEVGYVATSVIKNTLRLRPLPYVGAIYWCESKQFAPAPLVFSGAVDWVTVHTEPVIRATASLDDRAGRARYKQVKKLVKDGQAVHAGRRWTKVSKQRAEAAKNATDTAAA